MDQGSAALKAKEQPKMVAVRFWLKFHVDYGQSIRIIGGHDAMGECCMQQETAAEVWSSRCCPASKGSPAWHSSVTAGTVGDAGSLKQYNSSTFAACAEWQQALVMAGSCFCPRVLHALGRSRCNAHMWY
jgi:hypothetical protein